LLKTFFDQRQIVLQVPVVGDLPVLYAVDVDRAEANLAAFAFHIFEDAGVQQLGVITH
jgi:hypothetical protein